MRLSRALRVVGCPAVPVTAPRTVGQGLCLCIAALEVKSDYVMINHARWDHSPPLFMARQLPKRTFRSYMLANLRARHLSALPVLYRLP